MAKCQKAKITVEIESNCKEFMRTRKFPKYRRANLSVNWVEKWRDKDGEEVDLEFTRIIRSGERQRSYSFAFMLASGMTTSLSRAKIWDSHYSTLKGEGWSRWQEFKDLYESRLDHPAPRVVRVVVSVNFGDIG
jgi:hypothetical protein